ncbi:MAG: sigma-70 family RNA polymerase sigma factor [Verrucomicrobiia bacterium]
MESDATQTQRLESAVEDRELVARCQQGDLAAFDQLISKYRARVFAMIHTIVRNEQDAWDISQEGFVRAWRGLGRFRDESSFATWLYRVMTNAALDFLRKTKNRRTVSFDETFLSEDEGELIAERGADASPHGMIQRKELAQRINTAVESLSPEHRAVILLKEVEGLQYHEIAERLGISLGTVMSRLFYARKYLQRQLLDIYEERR